MTSSLSPTERPDTQWVAVGRVLAPWGLRGDVRIEPLTDHPERFAPGSDLWLRRESRRIEASRTQRGRVILKLFGVDSVDAAEVLRGEFLEVPLEAVPALPEDWYYHFQLLGLQVWTEDERNLGAIEEILETGANDVYIVRGTGREYLIPAIGDVVQRVDLETGRLVIRDLPGLLD